jgi:hypothetical protein
VFQSVHTLNRRAYIGHLVLVDTGKIKKRSGISKLITARKSCTTTRANNCVTWRVRLLVSACSKLIRVKQEQELRLEASWYTWRGRLLVSACHCSSCSGLRFSGGYDVLQAAEGLGPRVFALSSKNSSHSPPCPLKAPVTPRLYSLLSCSLSRALAESVSEPAPRS